MEINRAVLLCDNAPFRLTPDTSFFSGSTDVELHSLDLDTGNLFCLFQKTQSMWMWKPANTSQSFSQCTMSLNIPGLVVMVLFYLLVLGTGIWASMKSKQVHKSSQADQTEITLLGNRGISLAVGVFTMTGECGREGKTTETHSNKSIRTHLDRP